MSELVLRSDHDGLVILTLNRPEKLNALTPELFVELDQHVDDIASSIDTLGLVIIRGAGRAFSAGNDLSRLAGRTSEESRAIPPQARTIEKVAKLPQPVIVAVTGFCLTGALELALAGDLIVASESAVFSDTHATWGLTPRWGMSQRLPRRIGRSKALEMMVTARRYPGYVARDMGLADHCWPDSEFEEQLSVLTAEILAGSWFTQRAAKRMLAETEGLSLVQGLAHEAYHGKGTAPDSTERVTRFARR